MIQRLVSGRRTNGSPPDRVFGSMFRSSANQVFGSMIRSSAGYESLDTFPRDLHRLSTIDIYLFICLCSVQLEDTDMIRSFSRLGLVKEICYIIIIMCCSLILVC